MGAEIPELRDTLVQEAWVQEGMDGEIIANGSIGIQDVKLW
jgi:hypothetical protein